MEKGRAKEHLELLRPMVTAALSQLRVPRSDCNFVMVDDPDYNNWELRFRLRLDEPAPDEAEIRGHLAFRMETNPFWTGEAMAYVAIYFPDGRLFGETVPPIWFNPEPTVRGVVRDLRHLLNEYDPKVWSCPGD